MKRYKDITDEAKVLALECPDDHIDISLFAPKDTVFETDRFKAMEWGNRVAYLPNKDEYETAEDEMRAVGIDPDADMGSLESFFVTQKEGRLPLLSKLCRHNKVIQIVGGHPSAYANLRPEGVDEVWAVNPRLDWPVDKPPDMIVSRDFQYLRGPCEDDGGKSPTFGKEILERWPEIPIIVSADIGQWFADCLNGKRVCPPHLLGRQMYELALQNFFDTRFSDLSGFSIGAALAAAKHVGAKIVLTGVVCSRTDEEYNKSFERNGKFVEKQKFEDEHIAYEVREWLNINAGKCVWTYGPTVPGSVAPVWNDTL